MPVSPKFCPTKLAEFLVGMTRLRKSFRKKAIFWYRKWKECSCPSSGVLSIFKKVLKAVISMKSAVSKDKLIISGVRNWLGLGAIQVTMIFGT